MNAQTPALSELQELLVHVRQTAPERLPAMQYLTSLCRQLSILTLENVLALPAHEELSLEAYHRVKITGTLPEDLALLAGHVLSRTLESGQKQRLVQLLKILERLSDFEAHLKVARVLH